MLRKNRSVESKIVAPQILTLLAKWRSQVARGETPDSCEVLAALDTVEFVAALEQLDTAPQDLPSPAETCSLVTDSASTNSPEAGLQLPGPRLSDRSSGSAAAERALPELPDYEIVRKIAQGGMGVVYEARQRSLNRTVALKMIRAGDLAGEHDIARFYAEAEAAAGLRHPNIVAVYEVGRVGDSGHYFTMDFVPGQSLQELIRQQFLPIARAVTYLIQVARAIQFAHDRGVLHRDLKPSNILLGDDDQPRVADFGLAKRLHGDSGLTLDGMILGTPSYMSPEQARGEQASLGPASDIYSLGAVLYECLTGRPPFSSPNLGDLLLQVTTEDPLPPSRLVPKLAVDLETICLKCLEKLPARRYASAGEFADDLERYQRDEPIRARRTGMVERGLKFVRRQPATAALASVIVAAVAIVLIVITIYSRSLASRNQELTQTVGKLNTALADVKTQQNKAETQTTLAKDRYEALRRTNYASQFKLAETDYLSDPPQLARAEELLRSLVPQPGEVDLRGPEWRFLYRLARFQSPYLVEGRVTSLQARKDGSLLILRWFGNDYAVERYLNEQRVSQAAFKSMHSLRPGVFAPQGDLFVTPSYSGSLQVRRIDQPAKVEFELGGEATETCAALSNDGKLLAWTAPGKPLELYDLEQRTAIQKFDTEIAKPQLVQLSPNGEWALVAGQADTVLIRLMNRQRTHYRETNSSKVVGIAFSPDSQALAIAYSDSRVTLVSTEAPEKLRPMTLLRLRIHPTCITFVGSNQRIALGSLNSLVFVMDATQNIPRIYRGQRGPVSCLCAGAEPDQLFSGSEQGDVLAWDAAVEDQRAAVIRGQSDAGEAVVPMALAYSPDGEIVVVGGRSFLTAGTKQEGHLLFYDAASKELIKRWQVPTPVVECRFSSDGQQVFWKEQDGPLQYAFRTRPTSLPDETVAPLPTDLSVPAATLLGAKGILVGDAAGELHLAGGETDSAWPQKVRRSKPFRTTDLLATPDGRLVLSRGDDNFLRLWDAQSQEEIAWSIGHLANLPLALSADGRFAAWTVPEPPLAMSSRAKPPLASSPETQVKDLAPHARALVFNIRARRIAFLVSGHVGEVTALSLSSDGRRLASGDKSGVIKMWDVETGNELLSLSAHPQGVRAIAFQPQGLHFASVGVDGTLRIWDCSVQTMDADQ